MNKCLEFNESFSFSKRMIHHKINFKVKNIQFAKNENGTMKEYYITFR